MHQRKHERVQLAPAILIHDVVHQRTLGELVNITIEGMMSIGETPVELDAILQISLELPEPIAGEDHIDLGVICLWTREAEHSNRYWAGFQIIDASMQSIKRIESLIRDHRVSGEQAAQ